MNKIITLQANKTWEGMAEIFPDVIFSHAGGEELKMQIIAPWWNREGTEIPQYPLVVFVQGSAWTFPGVWYQIPQLSELARKGYVVATITHRNSLEGHPFPACLQDVKTAIRFLRKNASQYGIDAERIGLWGTSSGANLSLLAAMTEGEERYITEEYSEYSDHVNFVAACFPTTDLVEYMLDEEAEREIKDIFTALSGGEVDEEMSVLREMSPYYRVKERDAVTYPPLLIAHGDADELIPHQQSVKLYKELEKKGADVTMVTVEGAPHEDAFWSQEMLELIYDFIRKAMA